MIDPDVVGQAMEFSTKAHEGQRRLDAKQIPYITHVAEVAELVERSGGNQLEIAAAWLHDIVEHTKTTLDDIRTLFGDEVAQLIDELTDPKEFDSMPISERKTNQAARIKEKSASARRIKIADQTSNVLLVGGGVLLETDPIESLDYVEGAKKVADACAGVSPMLDKVFAEAYKSGVARYRHI